MSGKKKNPWDVPSENNHDAPQQEGAGAFTHHVERPSGKSFERHPSGGDRPPSFFEKLSNGYMPVVMLIGAGFLLWMLSGFYIVSPKEQGVELIFGRFSGSVGPGLHYNFPSPIGTVYRPSVTTINQVDVGFRPDGEDVLSESQMLTGDENILNVQFVVFWKIRDAGQYLFAIKDPRSTVKNVAEAAMREMIGKTEFEYARTTGRTKLASGVKTLIQQTLDSYHSGIEIVGVNLQRVDPPKGVIDAFRDVQAARADQERSVNEAIGYKNNVTQRAQGFAGQVLQDADAYKQEKIDQASGDAQRFLQVYQQYRSDPNVTQKTLYFNTIQDILAHVNKVVVDPNVTAKGGIYPVIPFAGAMNNNHGGSSSASSGKDQGAMQHLMSQIDTNNKSLPQGGPHE